MAITGVLVRKAATAALRAKTSKQRPEKHKGSHLPPGRAILLGAGLMTAGRWLVQGRAGPLAESVQQWVEEIAQELEDDEQPEEEAYSDEEPEGEAGEDLEDEAGDEPEAEADEDFEDEADEDFDDESETDAEPSSEAEEVAADAE